MERMENIDFKAITAEAVSKISNMPLSLNDRYWSGQEICVDVSPEKVRTLLLDRVWNEGVKLLNEQYECQEPLAIERAICELKHRGVVKDGIVFKKESFRLQLENGKYRAYKSGVTGPFYACPWPSYGRYKVLVPGSIFAGFVLDFDAGIPEMVARVPEIIDTIRARKLEETRKSMELELKRQVIESLISQYLKPLGLEVRYEMKEGDTVSLDISQSLASHLEIPFDKLADKFKDTTAILSSLEVQPVEEDDFDHYPDSFLFGQIFSRR